LSTALEGKVVLVTGGARRVGAAIARRLHASGANLVIHYRSSAAEARALKDELAAARRDSVVLVQADLLKAATHAGIVKDALKAYGRIDALVNNASSV
jgi:pteridine reductase